MRSPYAPAANDGDLVRRQSEFGDRLFRTGAGVVPGRPSTSALRHWLRENFPWHYPFPKASE